MKFYLELTIFTLLSLVTLAIFIPLPLDLLVSSAFFDGENFSLGSLPVWEFLYWLMTPVTLLMFFGSLAVIIYASVKKQRLLRGYAAVVFLTLLLGPGIIVNGIFKDHWQRPRPVQTEQFGGSLKYVPPMVVGDVDGPTARSFPSGHSSVAFSLIAIWFLLRRRHPLWANRMLPFTLVFGLYVGMARMVAGGHYLSDVLFSAYFTFLAASLSYHVLIGIPRLEDEHLAPERVIHLPFGFRGNWEEVHLWAMRQWPQRS